jgi:uncharacterized protein YggE
MDSSLLPKWMARVMGVLFIIFLGLLIIALSGYIKGSSQTLRVSAEGRVSAIPDTATVTIGVVSQGANPVDVKNMNNQKMNQIIAFIKQQGVDAKDITTTGFYASPKYNYSNGQNTIDGYQATQSVMVKISSIDKSQAQLEKVVDGAVNNGANEIQGVAFSFANPEKLRQLARKQAIEKAKEKAQELANEAGLSLGKIINITDSINESFNPVPLAMANYSGRSKSVAPNIEPGNQEVVENVVLIFNI